MSQQKDLRSLKRSQKNPYVLIEYIDDIGSRRFKIHHRDNLPNIHYRVLVRGSFNYCRQYLIDTWGYDPTAPVEEENHIPFLRKK
jgi:hypothetical protein